MENTANPNIGMTSLWFEDRLRKDPFSRRINVVGSPSVERKLRSQISPEQRGRLREGSLHTGQVTHQHGAGGGGVLPEILGRGVRPASQNPYPIYA